MPRLGSGGAELAYDEAGDGPPLVVVHGSWSDRHTWDGVAPKLAERFRVVWYDRRGHSESTAPPGQGVRTEDEDDLSAMIEEVAGAPANVAANSFGAVTALGLASRRPGLFRTLLVHEPPALGLFAGTPEVAPLLEEGQARIQAVVEVIEAGDAETGARRFVEEIAFGPGEWEKLPERIRQTFVRNAATWVDEQRDPHWAELDLEALSRYGRPLMVTRGTESPAWFDLIVAKVVGAVPGARTHVFEGAGHAPHLSHPDDYVEVLTGFFQRES